MTWRILRKRAFALALAAAVSISVTLPAAAEEAISDGVTPVYDEAYYATLDYYGNLLEGSMVKSYAMNGKDSLTDYGVYDEVVNLTDATAPVSGEGGATSFRFNGTVPDHFYFEGKTKQPFQDLPWRIAVSYTLNGVPAKAEDLAGKQGVVEILLDIVPNEAAGDYARYNYTLAATALFNQDDILSLEAPGAQVQLVGNLRTVLFLCLPGEERHFTIRVGSGDFSFGGLTVLMVPATLAQLEEIARLSERKDDLEEDYEALSGSLDNLLDALSDIQSGLYASARGLDQLNAARGTFSGGKGALYDGADRLRGDLSGIAERLIPVEQRVQVLSTTLTDSRTLLNGMADATLDLQSQLEDLEKALYGLERGTYDLRNVIDIAAGMESSLLRLENALGGTHVSGGSIRTNSKALVEKVKNVHSAYTETDQTAFMLKMLKAQGMGDAQAQAQVQSIGQLSAAVQGGQIKPEQLTGEQKAALETAKQMQDLHAAAQSGKLPFKDFCGQLPGVSADQAKQMNDLWLIYNSGAETGSAARDIISGRAAETPARAEQTPPAPEKEEKEESGVDTESDDNTSTVDGETGGKEVSASADGNSEETVSETGTDEESRAEENKDDENTGAADTDSGNTPMMKAKRTGDRIIEARSVQYGTGDGDGSDSGGTTGDSTDGTSADSDAPSGSSGADSTPGDSDTSSGSSGTDSNSDGSTDGTDGNTPADPAAPDTSDNDTPSTPGTDASGTGTPAVSSENQTVGGAVVDIITEGLDSASARIDAIQGELMDSLNAIEGPASAVVGKLADLCGELDCLVDDLDDAEDLMAALQKSSGTLRDILADTDALRTVLNGYEPILQEALANAGTLSTAAVTTIQDTEALIADAESLARDAGGDLDAGTKQSLNGLSAALRQTAKALAATDDVRGAKKTITDIIEDTWNEYTGDVNNILMMDAAAEPVSLTDERNPAPSSIQVLIRTQEIKAEEPDGEEKAAAEKEKTTLWGRVARMFKDFWNAVTGIFH